MNPTSLLDFLVVAKRPRLASPPRIILRHFIARIVNLEAAVGMGRELQIETRIRFVDVGNERVGGVVPLAARLGKMKLPDGLNSRRRL